MFDIQELTVMHNRKLPQATRDTNPVENRKLGHAELWDHCWSKGPVKKCNCAETPKLSAVIAVKNVKDRSCHSFIFH